MSECSELRKKRIALLFWPKTGYQSEVLRGVRQYVENRPDWECEAFFSNKENIPLLAGWHPRGVVGMIESPPIAAAVAKMRVPSVDVACWFAKPPGARVGVDNHGLGVLAADYLSGLGVASFGFLGLTDAFFARERCRGFTEKLTVSGFTCNTLFLRNSDDPFGHNAYPAWWGEHPDLTRWLKTLPKPTGILACTDQLAIALLATCRSMELPVPEKMAVLGIDDDDLLCSLAKPTLSSIKQPMRQIGFEAGRLLNDILCGVAKADATVGLPPVEIVERASTRLGPGTISDPDVRAAAHFIRDHAGQDIHIGGLVNKLLVSRRSLELKFKREIGHTIQEEIRRARVDKAKKLLTETDLPLKSVASQAGFSNVKTLSMAFRRHVGMTARKHRTMFRLRR